MLALDTTIGRDGVSVVGLMQLLALSVSFLAHLRFLPCDGCVAALRPPGHCDDTIKRLLSALFLAIGLATRIAAIPVTRFVFPSCNGMSPGCSRLTVWPAMPI